MKFSCILLEAFIPRGPAKGPSTKADMCSSHSPMEVRASEFVCQMPVFILILEIVSLNFKVLLCHIVCF